MRRKLTLFIFILLGQCYAAHSQQPALKHFAAIKDLAGKALISNARGIDVAGNYAYVVSGANGGTLQILDISNPYAPTYKGSLDHVNFALPLLEPTDVKVVVDYAFVVNQFGFDIVNVSNPSMPVYLSSVGLGSDCNLAISGHYAYVTVSQYGLFVIYDISNPANPVEVSRLKDDQTTNLRAPGATAISGDYAYVLVTDKLVSAAYAVEVINIKNPLVPVHSNILSTGPGGGLDHVPESICAANNFLYLAGPGALDIVDVTDPKASVVKSSLISNTSGPYFGLIQSIVVDGKYLFVGNSYALEIVDVSDPGNPKHVILINNDGNENDPDAIHIASPEIYVRDNFLYFTSGYPQSIFQILDLQNLPLYFRTGSISDGEPGGSLMANSTRVRISGNYAYVAAKNALNIIDVSNPKKPVLKSALKNGSLDVRLGSLSDVCISGSYAYLTSLSENSLIVVDISNPLFPKIKGSLVSSPPFPFHQPTSIAIRGTVAFITSEGDKSIAVIDIADPINPIFVVAYYNLEDGASLTKPHAMVLKDDLAYVVNSDPGSLEISSIANSASLLHKGKLLDGNGALLQGASAICVVGNTAYIAGSLGLEIADVTDPSNPLHLSSLINGTGGALLENPTGIEISGHYAFISSAGSNAVEVIDISNVVNPVHFTTLVDETGGAFVKNPSAIALSGNTGFVTSAGQFDQGGGLEIFSIYSPAIPQQVSASSVGQTSFEVSWSASVNATSYFLDVSPDNFSTIPVRKSTALPTQTVTSEILPGTTYYYRVAAVNNYDTSLFSTAQHLVTIPATPIGEATEPAHGDGRFYALWKASKGAQQYFINVSTDPLMASNFIGSYKDFDTGNHIKLLIDNVPSGKECYFQIRAANSTGSSPYSDPTLVGTITGINEPDTFDLYPNPAESFLNIKLSGNTPSNFTSVEIYNLQGQKLSSRNYFEEAPPIDISSLSTGVYYVKIVRPDKSIQRILIKN
jgi:hypothetical protein